MRLHAGCYELMGFKVVDKGGIAKYYCYVVLVFGFKVAAQVLGRVLKPVMNFLIQNGIPVTLYIDDGLLVGPSKDRVMRRYRFALDVFNKAGLLISFEKSSLPEDPSTKVEFLGVCIDTESMCVYAPPQKIKDLREVISIVQRVRSVPVRTRAFQPSSFHAWLWKSLSDPRYLWAPGLYPFRSVRFLISLDGSGASWSFLATHGPL
jgi:hypothetical protein